MISEFDYEAFLAWLDSKLNALSFIFHFLFWAKKYWEGLIFPELEVVDTYRKTFCCVS